MIRFENQRITGWRDFDSGHVYENAEFVSCRFDNCSVSAASRPELRSTFRNMRFFQCTVSAMPLGPAIVEEVLVDGLQTGGNERFLLQVFGAVFKHVTLRGNIGDLMLTPFLGIARTSAEQRAFDAANAEYYRHVDWALDIRDAAFTECDIRNVPARLIRRDPKSQVVVTRKRALEGRWRELDLSRTYWPVTLDLFLQREDEDVVLVAAKQDPSFQNQVVGLECLRRAGVAEPD